MSITVINSACPKLRELYFSVGDRAFIVKHQAFARIPVGTPVLIMAGVAYGGMFEPDYQVQDREHTGIIEARAEHCIERDTLPVWLPLCIRRRVALAKGKARLRRTLGGAV